MSIRKADEFVSLDSKLVANKKRDSFFKSLNLSERRSNDCIDTLYMSFNTIVATILDRLSQNCAHSVPSFSETI